MSTTEEMTRSRTSIRERIIGEIHEGLVGILGASRASVVEHNVDIRLAVDHTEEFERAMSEFMGAQPGWALIDGIRSRLLSSTDDVKAWAGKSFSGYKVHPMNEWADQLIGTENQKRSDHATIYSVRFVETVHMATDLGIRFSDLVTEGLIEMLGETCAYPTLASIGGEALLRPNVFAENITSLFGFGGRTILNSLILFAEKKLARRQPVVSK